MNVKEFDFIDELSTLQAKFTDNVIKIADKHDRNRNDVTCMVAETTFTTLYCGDFTDYQVTPENDVYNGPLGTERLISFLFELSKLSVKYGFIIGGCGCCGSPYITDINCNDGDFGCEDLKFNDSMGLYNASYNDGTPVIHHITKRCDDETL